MKKRESNFEALRLLAMALVVTLHYLSKGNVLKPLTEELQWMDWAAWLLEAFAYVAVNAYVLLTGYFMCQSKFRLGRLLQIILEVWFYSLVIPLVLGAFGILNLGALTIYDWLILIFPLSMQHYWFLSVYVLLVIISPLLNRAIAAMNQKQLAGVTILVALPQVLLKSILPLTFTMDDGGWGILWFVELYLIAAYIRKYGIPFLSTKTKAALVYLAGVLLTWGGGLVMNRIYLATGRFSDKVTFTFSYNHIFILIASVGFFCIFANMKSGEGLLSRLILRLAPYSLGVYLLHENILLRYEWPVWLSVAMPNSLIQLIVEWIVKVAIVMVVGLFVDFLRSLLFMAGGRILAHTPVPRWMQKCDEVMN
ncbi:MAG: acyltransferase [Lachnospiraceae bacterium]|nr:acyltransferase [Lachnospiraceae bacterium]